MYLTGAFYGMARGDLLVVVLNTNLYYDVNEETEGMPDPADQLQWLDATLKQAKEDTRKVHCFKVGQNINLCKYSHSVILTAF